MTDRYEYRLLTGNTVEEGIALPNIAPEAPSWSRMLWPETRFIVSGLARAHLSRMEAMGLPVH